MEARGWISVRQRWQTASPLARGTALALLAICLLPPAVGSRGLLATAAAPLLGLVALRAGRGAAHPMPRRLWVPAAAWLAGLALSSLLGGLGSPVALLPAGLGLLALWLGWQLRTRADADAVLAALAAAAVLVALHGVLQHAGWDPIRRVDEFPDRVVGPFVNPNHLGSLAAVCLPVLLVWHLRASGGLRGARPVAGALAGAAALLVYTVLLLAGSRGALWAGLAGMAVVAAGYGRAVHLRRRRLRLAGPLCLLVSMGLVTALLQQRPVLRGPEGEQVSVGQRLAAMSHVAGEAAVHDVTVLHRRVLWRTAWQLFAADPLVGAGPGRFAEAGAAAVRALSGEREVTLLADARRLVLLPHAHNEALHAAAESGLAGLVPLFVLAVVGWVGGLRCAWRTGELWVWAAVGACATVMVHGLVSYPLHLPASAGSYWILLGILFSAERL